MKNVLQLIGSFHQGGSERQAVQLTRLLREDGSVNLHVAALNKEGVLLGEIERLDLPEIPEFKLTSFYDANFIRQVRRFARFLRDRKIDVVQTHDFYGNVFGMAAASLAGVKCKIAAKRETGGMRSRAQKIVEKFAFARADRIIANSEAVKNYLLAEGVAASKIKIVYNGLDLERLKPQTTSRHEICALLDLPTGEKIKFVTLVANLRHTVKNQPMFLRAAQKVLRNFKDAYFVLAGEGELRNELEKLAEELQISQNTHFIGRCTRVPELLAVSEICVLTSFHEGFSNSILEYMAAGRAVVATRVGGASEAVVEGETGFLVESDDDQTLSERLTELLQNPEKSARFGLAGQNLAREKFSLFAQIEKTLELYEL